MALGYYTEEKKLRLYLCYKVIGYKLGFFFQKKKYIYIYTHLYLIACGAKNSDNPVDQNIRILWPFNTNF